MLALRAVNPLTSLREGQAGVGVAAADDLELELVLGQCGHQSGLCT